jgi:hypothetical protein
MSYNNGYEEIKSYVESRKGGILFALGGLGDFLIALDVCSINKLSLIFWINNTNIEGICKKFVEFYKVDAHLYNCKIGIGTDDAEAYLKKVCVEVLAGKVLSVYNNMWHEFPKIDFTPDPKNNIYDKLEEHKINIPSNYFVICPAGSKFHTSERRLFYKEEFHELIDLSIDKGFIPFIVGNDKQIDFYDERQKCRHLQFDKFDGKEISIGNFLYVINKSQFVISVDTFLKTLSGLMNKKTYMIRNRNEDNIYHSYGVGRWDHIFTNPKIWKHLEMLKFEEIIEKIKRYSYINGNLVNKIKFV